MLLQHGIFQVGRLPWVPIFQITGVHEGPLKFSLCNGTPEMLPNEASASSLCLSVAAGSQLPCRTLWRARRKHPTISNTIAPQKGQHC